MVLLSIVHTWKCRITGQVQLGQNHWRPVWEPPVHTKYTERVCCVCLMYIHGVHILTIHQPSPSFPLPGMCPSPPPPTRCDHKNLLSSNLVPLSKTRAPKNPPLARLPPEMCPYTVVQNRMSGFCVQSIGYKVCARDYDILTHLYFWNNVLGLSQIRWHWWKPVLLTVASNNLFSVSRSGKWDSWSIWTLNQSCQ